MCEYTLLRSRSVQSIARLDVAHLLVAFLMAILVVSPANADSDGGGYGGGPDGGNGETDRIDKAIVAPAKEALKLKSYAQAILILKEIDQENPNNADVLNLLGFSHRKIGKFDEAFSYYNLALTINPKHRGAHEYLGELYLQVDDLPKAEKQLAILDDLCLFTCKQIKQLRKAIAAYKAQ